MFDWTTEEDEAVWEEVASRPEPPPEPKKRPYWTLAIIGTLLLVAAAVVYWQVQNRVEAAMVDVRSDLLSTHNLVNRAVEMQDVDLLAPLLSGRDMIWTRNQEQMMRDDGLFGRSVLGLPLAQPPTTLAEDDERLVALELSPDLNSAELQFVELYRFGDEEVPLQQTAVYRRGRDRWLMAPPEDEFWGGWKTINIEEMSFVFAERDADLGKQLAADLNSRILQRCHQAEDFDCPDLSQLSVRFDTDVATLVALSDPAVIYDAKLRLELPSPTLVGIPVDDAGYDALLRAYEAQIFTAVLGEAIGYECCHHAPVVQAVTDYYLADIGLKPWPVSVTTFSEIANDILTIERLNWSKDSFLSPWDEDFPYVYSFVDFLMSTEPTKTPVEMLRQLRREQSLPGVLAEMFEGRYGEGVYIQDVVIRDWWIYARAQAQETAQQRPLPLPYQDLLLSCDASNYSADVPFSRLLRFDTASGEWQEDTDQVGIMFLNPLPQDNGAILQSIDFETNIWQSYIWENGEIRRMVADEFLLSLGQTDSSGRYVVAFTGSPETEQFQPTLFDLGSCDENGCTATAINDMPIWSPNAEHSLLINSNIFEDSVFAIGNRVASFNSMYEFVPVSIVLGDSLGNPMLDRANLIGEGSMPFWLTDEMFGYIAIVDDPTNPVQELRIGEIDDLQTRPLISATNLLYAIPADERPVRLTMRYAMPNPANPDMLAVMASYQQNGYLFTVDRVSGEVQLRLQAQLQAQHLFGFSPDGRYLVVSANPEGERNDMGIFNAIYVHDLAANETEVFETGLTSFMPAFTFDWSANGDWLAFSYSDGFVWLYAPEYDYQELLAHDAGECASLAWVNR